LWDQNAAVRLEDFTADSTVTVAEQQDRSERQRLTTACKKRLKGANINEETLLATDYLNHFNEIVMLMDFVAEMPECMDELREWQPLGYQEFFYRSTRSDKELVIDAYDFAPAEYREPFDAVVLRLHAGVERGIREIERAVLEKPHDVERLCSATAAFLRRLLELAAAIINGNYDSLQQADIDQLLDLD